MPRGEYQLLIEEIQPKGIGPLELAFRQLKKKLSSKAISIRKETKAAAIGPIVLVTSPERVGSVRHAGNPVAAWPAAEVWDCPVHVQGEGLPRWPKHRHLQPPRCQGAGY